MQGAEVKARVRVSYRREGAEWAREKSGKEKAKKKGREKGISNNSELRVLLAKDVNGIGV